MKRGVAYPTTWEELRDVSKSVSVKNGDIVEMKGFEMFDTDSLICNYLAMILQAGGQYLEEDDSVNFATPEGVAAMEEILSMIKNGECDLTHLTDGDYCFNDVYQDKGYMASVGSWAIGEGTDTYELEYGTDLNMCGYRSTAIRCPSLLRPDGDLSCRKMERTKMQHGSSSPSSASRRIW